MVKKNTVFILGAGASSDFGYPLGNKLREEIYMVFRASDTAREELAKALSMPSDKYEETKNKIKEFADALYYNADYSIDAFLEKFKDKYLTIGKMAIAYILSKKENEDIFFNTENWYRFLLKKMKEGTEIDTFTQKNKVSFITFNYDRSLEYFLHKALTSWHEDITPEKVVEIMNQMPIIHLYGQLDPLPWQDENGRAYGVPLNVEHLKKYKESLSIVFENINENKDVDSRFGKAFKLFQDAERVYIVGFGFHEENITRLRLSGVIFNSNILFKGTAFEISDKEISNIREKFAKFHKIIGENITGLFLQKPELYQEKVYDFISKRAELD